MKKAKPVDNSVQKPANPSADTEKKPKKGKKASNRKTIFDFADNKSNTTYKLISADDAPPITRQSSGSLSIDCALNGGFYRHSLNILTGKYMSGKSNLITSAMQEAIIDLNNCLVADFEKGATATRAKISGKIPGSCVYDYEYADNANVIMEELLNMISNGAVGLVAIDSLAAMVHACELPEEEGQYTMTKDNVAIRSQMKKAIENNRFMRQLGKAFSDARQIGQEVTMIAVGHTYKEIGGNPKYPQEVLKGGSETGFMMRSHLDLKGVNLSINSAGMQLSERKKDGRDFGNPVKFKIKKNTFGKTSIEGQYPLFNTLIKKYNVRPGEIGQPVEVLTLGLEYNAIIRKGQMYSIPSMDVSIKGKDNFIRYIWEKLYTPYLGLKYKALDSAGDIGTFCRKNHQKVAEVAADPKKYKKLSDKATVARNNRQMLEVMMELDDKVATKATELLQNHDQIVGEMKSSQWQELVDLVKSYYKATVYPDETIHISQTEDSDDQETDDNEEEEASED